MTRRILVVVVTAALLLPVTASASSPMAFYAFTGGSYAGPSTSELLVPVVVIPEGADLYLFNTQFWGHSMYSDLNGRNDRLFWSELVPFGKATLVNGVSSLQPGSFGFHCSNHPSMKGILTVVDKEKL